MHSENPSSKKPLNLPEEISEEILSRLPVKSVLRFRCVSKSWLSLVEGNGFIKIHYQNSSKNTSLAHHRVILNVYGGFRCYSLQSLLNSNSKKGSSSSSSCNNISSISMADPTDKGGVTSVRGCCNGVLCLLSAVNIPYPGLIFWLWNPATKVLVELPQLLIGFPFKIGFGWDESSGAFKVFATTATREDDSHKTIGHVYSSKTNSWKRVLLPRVESNGYLFNYLGVFVCGRIHWGMQLHDHEHYVIVSFNLENDEFERIELPPLFDANATEEAGDLAPETWLGEIGGCLCTSFHDIEKKRIDVWVMKEYGVKDSWFKRLTFPFPDDLHVSRLDGNPPLFGECGLNGEIFITCINKLMVYSPKDGDFSEVADLDPYFRAFLYVESLVSPLRITTIRGANT